MSINKSKSIIAVGIEVAGFEYINNWIREGHLPTISSIIKNGSWGKLLSTSDISSGSIWPSFSTGISPAKNGQYFTHMQLLNGTYRIVKKYADDVRGNPFWFNLNENGKKIGIVDVAQTFPLKNINGIQICGYGAEYPAWKTSSSPPSLIREITSRFGSNPLVNQYRLSIKPDTQKDFDKLFEKLNTSINQKGSLSEYLLKQQKWDFFLTMFPETHWAAHLLWQYLDKHHPAYDPKIVTPVENIFIKLFSMIDSFILKFKETNPDAVTLVFSGSGMGPNYSGWHLLPEVLSKLGYSSNHQNINGFSEKILPSKKWGSYKIRKMEDTLSLKLIENAKKIIPRKIWDSTARRILYSGNEWKNSKAFCIPNDYAGSIRINLKGREPNGIVEPENYFNLCDKISDELKELIDPDTGKKIVSEIIITQKEYKGENLNHLPDIIVKWNNEFPISTVYSSKTGKIEGQNPERRSGAHRETAFFAIAGNNIKSNENVFEASLLDLAPTILDLLNVKVPENYDGRVLKEILNS